MGRRLRVNSWDGIGGVIGQAAQVWPAENCEAEKAFLRGVRQGEPTPEQLLLAAPPTARAQGVAQDFSCAQRPRVIPEHLWLVGMGKQRV